MPRRRTPFPWSKILLVVAIRPAGQPDGIRQQHRLGSNLALVHYVLAMDMLFPDATIRYRAIQSVLLWQLAYALITLTASVIAVPCWTDVWHAGVDALE